MTGIHALIALAETQDTDTLIATYIGLIGCDPRNQMEHRAKLAVAEVLIRCEGEGLLDQLDAEFENA